MNAKPSIRYQSDPAFRSVVDAVVRQTELHHLSVAEAQSAVGYACELLVLREAQQRTDLDHRLRRDIRREMASQAASLTNILFDRPCRILYCGV